MPDIHLDRPRFRDGDEPEAFQYRAVSFLAIAALSLAVLAGLAFLSPMLWVIPWAGVGISALALRRIRGRAAELIGRKAALIGLVVSIVLGLAAPTQWFIRRYQVRAESKQFAMLWFDMLAKDAPQKALQLTVDGFTREPLDDSLWSFYDRQPPARTRLEEFVVDRTIRTLLALGDKSIVRYFDTEKQWEEGNRDYLRQVYAVTYQREAEPTTFFVAIELERESYPGVHRSFWKVGRYLGGMTPRALGGSGLGD